MVHLVLSVNHIMRIPLAHHVSLLRNVANQEGLWGKGYLERERRAWRR
jgi:hypothetical protein